MNQAPRAGTPLVVTNMRTTYPITPPSSVGQSIPDHDSSDELQFARNSVQTPPSSPPEPPQNYHKRNDRTRDRDTEYPPSARLNLKRPRLPSDDISNPEIDIFTFPRLPPIMDRLPSLVGRAKKRFRPFEQPHGLVPNALELRFSQRCLDSGETDISVSDIQHVCQRNAHHFSNIDKNSISGERNP